MSLKGGQVLVTGAAGFVGSHLVDALLEEGCQVIGLDNLATGTRDNIQQNFSNDRFSFIEGSILDSLTLTQCMQDVEYIFNLATLGVRHSLMYPKENHDVNAEGTLNILEIARTMKNKKIIHCSTSEVFGTAIDVPMTELHPTLPHTVYGASKLAAEAYVRAYHRSFGLKTSIVRPFNMFGPRSHYEKDSGELIPKTIVRALNNEPILIFGNGEHTRDFTFVQDTVQAMLLIAKEDTYNGDSFNVGSGFEISINEVVNKILKSIPESQSQIQFLDERPGDVARLFADSTLFFNIFSWKHTVNFDQGLEKTINWFKAHPKGVKYLLEHESGVNWKVAK